MYFHHFFSLFLNLPTVASRLASDGLNIRCFWFAIFHPELTLKTRMAPPITPTHNRTTRLSKTWNPLASTTTDSSAYMLGLDAGRVLRSQRARFSLFHRRHSVNETTDFMRLTGRMVVFSSYHAPP
ncbi:hypothetical protein EDD85DRAFT_546971 [Armillaria nabsnona]|nr:hypothetical protein EDD85DRAFT_546971 [Armillaria nabsnona]